MEPQFAYHSNAGFTATTKTNDALINDQQVKYFKYSPLGNYLALVYPEKIAIMSARDGKQQCIIGIANVLEFEFSPRENYLSTWTRFTKPEEGQEPKRNFVIWKTTTGKEEIAFVQKSQAKWNVQWTEDESQCARLVGQELQFYNSNQFSNGISNRLKIEGIADFSISPGKRSVVCVFIGEKKGAPASVRIFDILNLKQQLSQKSFFKADSVTFHWNRLGTHVLVFTHTDVDTTGKSYYGETSLYYLSITGNFDCKVELDKQGPIHDVAWSPNSKEFIVVYGTMPAKATLFDHKASPMYELGSAARNQVRYSPSGRLFFLAGFGNLAGDLDVWDRRSFKKIVTMQASNSSTCEWGPDGRHFMTTTLYKRMKVDNGIKIFHFTGVLVHQFDCKEMYDGQWRPDSAENWPERNALSPPPPGIKPPTPAKAAGKYVPPGLRNAQRSMEKMTLEKKVEKIGMVSGSQLETEKKIKNLNKKLKQIQDLRDKMKSGQPMELTQIQKIETEPSILQEIETLKAKLQ
ncbi:eukaryotic translation initiation factor eIF2A-domain-containing protein [Gorgonomyces haynaldii]|nr:eukaryotic translation initiation factor eIF2A-domain-containing protein [Gorgonomyces haynaldii]